VGDALPEGGGAGELGVGVDGVKVPGDPSEVGDVGLGDGAGGGGEALAYLKVLKV
jgi:hypothetical protein